MAGANMLIMYASGSNNITLSPRSGKGQFQPDINSAARVTLLDGTGISTDGVMIANIRCDSCITWDGGSMSPTSGQSNWIWGIKHGNALNSGDVSADIQAHDAYGAFTFDLPAGTSSDSANPFVQAATETQSAGSSPSSSSGDSDESSSESSSSGSSASSGESESPNSRIRAAHGVVMALVFVLLFPLGALTIYLPFSRKTLFVHAPLQLLSASLLIAGLVLGVVLGVRIDANDGYHQIIGYVIVGCLVLFQPALGVIRHRQHRRGGEKTIFGHVHPWLGRILILIGIINGGLGLHISGDAGSEEVPTWSVIVYSVVAGVVGILYIAVVSGFGIFRKRKGGSKEDMKYRNGNNNANNAYMGN